jgi:phosphonopyruvate decarboxylase
MDETGRPYALVMQKGSVAPYELKDNGATERRAPVTPQSQFTNVAASELASRHDALNKVIAHTPLDSTVVLASTGFCGRELYAIDDRPNQLYMVGSMGCVTPFALGLALARPDLHVVALDGDGAALMRMGAFATIGAYGPSNLTHVLLDNGAHDSTGGQATVSSQVSFAGVAAACGYASAVESDDANVIDALFEAAPLDGPRFARLIIRRGTPDGLPRPTITPPDVKTRLMRHIGAA